MSLGVLLARVAADAGSAPMLTYDFDMIVNFVLVLFASRYAQAWQCH